MSAPDRRRNFQDLAKLAKTGSLAPASGPLSQRLPAALGGELASDGEGTPQSMGSLRGTTTGATGADDSGVIDLQAVLSQAVPVALQGVTLGENKAANSFPPSAPGSLPAEAPRSSAIVPSAASIAAAAGFAEGPATGLATGASSVRNSVSAFTAAADHAAVLATPAPIAAAAEAPLSAPLLPATAHLAPPATTTTPQSKSKTSLLLVGGLVAACATAAGALFFLHNSDHGDATKEAPVTVVARGAAQAPTAQGTPEQKPAAKADDVATTDTLGQATTLTKDAPAVVAKRAGAVAAGAAPANAGPLAVAPIPDKAVEKPTAKVEVPTGPAGDLGSAMRQAAGPTESTATARADGPQFAAGSVPQKPSQGALTSAISGVMGAARACLPEDGPVSRASITFGSAGNVQSTTASGPQADCVKAALAKAHVAPFAEPSFTTSVTVRH